MEDYWGLGRTNGMNCTPPAIDDFPKDYFTEQERQAGAVVLHVLASLYLFAALAVVCDKYFVPAVGKICHALNMSNDVAGATFMAAATSAPELFVNVIGTFITEGDIGVGTIVGSAVFNILAVAACCGIGASMVVPLDWWPLTRDCLAYGITVSILICIIHDERVEWYEALALVVLYIVYIAVMYFDKSFQKCARGGVNHSRARRSHDSSFQSKASGEQALLEALIPLRIEHFQQNGNIKNITHIDASNNELSSGVDNVQKAVGKGPTDVQMNYVKVDVDGQQLQPQHMAQQQYITEQTTNPENADQHTDVQMNYVKVGVDGQQLQPQHMAQQQYITEQTTNPENADQHTDVQMNYVKVGVDGQQLQPQHMAQQQYITEQTTNPENADQHTDVQMNYVKVDVDGQQLQPEHMAQQQYITEQTSNPKKDEDENKDNNKENANVSDIVNAEKPESDESYSIIRYPKGKSWFRQITWVVIWPIHLLFFFTIPDCERPKLKKLFPVTFVMCIIWIGSLSYMVAWMITIIGDTLKIPDSVTGITFLAAGTSVPEAVSSVIVAKQGHGSMGISNSIGSNTFDILLCLGLPWLIKAAFLPIEPGHHWVGINSAGLEYSAISLLSTLLMLYVTFSLNKFRLDRKVGHACLIMYAVFLILASLIELNVFFRVNLPTCGR